MGDVDWELIVDNRFKYAKEDPEWYRVSLKDAALKLSDRSMSGTCVLAARFKVYLPHIFNYDVRADDVWIQTYPRSGTTWMQEMVWCINNDCDFRSGKQNVSLLRRSPTLRQLINDKVGVIQNAHDTYINSDSNSPTDLQPPYVIKNHIPATFIPKKFWTVKPKTIYVARNPKDVALSFFHYYKTTYKYAGTMNDFLSLYLSGLIEFGSQTSHIMDFWNLRHEPNVLFLTYEEMKKDLKKVIRIVAAFLEKAITNAQVEELFEYLQFDQMKGRACDMFGMANTTENHKGFSEQFFRQGKTGSYKDEMDQEMVDNFNQMIHRELTEKGCDIYA